MKQVPLYSKIFQYLKDMGSKVKKKVTMDFEKALWKGIEAIFSDSVQKMG